MRPAPMERTGRVWAAELVPTTDRNGSVIVWQTETGQTFYAEPGTATYTSRAGGRRRALALR